MSTIEGLVHTSDFVTNAAPVRGGRRHHHAKKVSAKTIRAHLRKHGLKPKGRVVLKGGDGDTDAPVVVKPPPPPPATATGGRRRGGMHHMGGKTKKASRRHSTSFHASLGRMMGL
jgi:hypothetical protein